MWDFDFSKRHWETPHKMKLHVFKNVKPKQAHDLKTMWTLMDKKATANTVLCF